MADAHAPHPTLVSVRSSSVPSTARPRRPTSRPYTPSSTSWRPGWTRPTCRHCWGSRSHSVTTWPWRPTASRETRTSRWCCLQRGRPSSAPGSASAGGIPWCAARQV